MSSTGRKILGVLLFLCVPFVLYIYVRQPEPLIYFFPIAFVVMMGFRFIAFPYMKSVHRHTCIWCWNDLKQADTASQVELPAPIDVFTCPEHKDQTLQFFVFLSRYRYGLWFGIFGPLLVLLVALVLKLKGIPGPVLWATPLFQFVVAITVLATSVLYQRETMSHVEMIPFPIHTFYLLGIRTILWIFRIVGIYWLIYGGWKLVKLILS